MSEILEKFESLKETIEQNPSDYKSLLEYGALGYQESLLSPGECLSVLENVFMNSGNRKMKEAALRIQVLIASGFFDLVSLAVYGLRSRSFAFNGFPPIRIARAIHLAVERKMGAEQELQRFKSEMGEELLGGAQIVYLLALSFALYRKGETERLARIANDLQLIDGSSSASYFPEALLAIHSNDEKAVFSIIEKLGAKEEYLMCENIAIAYDEKLGDAEEANGKIIELASRFPFLYDSLLSGSGLPRAYLDNRELLKRDLPLVIEHTNGQSLSVVLELIESLESPSLASLGAKEAVKRLERNPENGIIVLGTALAHDSRDLRTMKEVKEAILKVDAEQALKESALLSLDGDIAIIEGDFERVREIERKMTETSTEFIPTHMNLKRVLDPKTSYFSPDPKGSPFYLRSKLVDYLYGGTGEIKLRKARRFQKKLRQMLNFLPGDYRTVCLTSALGLYELLEGEKEAASYIFLEGYKALFEHPEACSCAAGYYAYSYLFGLGVEKNVEKAKEILENIWKIKEGDVSQTVLASTLYLARITEEGMEEALRRYEVNYEKTVFGPLIYFEAMKLKGKLGLGCEKERRLYEESLKVCSRREREHYLANPDHFFPNAY